MQNTKKLDSRSKQGIFVGYDKRSPAYLVFYPDSNKVERVRCVKFFNEDNHDFKVDLDQRDDEFPPSKVSAPVSAESTTAIPGGESTNSPKSACDQARYLSRNRTSPTYLNEYVTGNVADDPTAYVVDYCYRTCDRKSHG